VMKSVRIFRIITAVFSVTDPSEIILTCLFAAEFGLLDHIFSEQKYSFL